MIQLINKNTTILNMQATTKKQALNELAQTLVDAKVTTAGVEEIVSLMQERENLGSTGFENGIAIPHIKSNLVTKNTIVIGKSTGLDFDSMDKMPTKLFFFIATSNQGDNEHLKILASLSQKLMDKNFIEKLLECENFEALNLVLKQAFNEKEAAIEKINSYDIVAVSACPTGIAHTYMAQKALTDKAQQLGYTIKVQTNGQAGVNNLISKQEAKNAKAIILANDISIDESNFDGLEVHRVSVAKALKESEKVINDALNTKGTIVKAKLSQQREMLNQTFNFYKHLMSGVTHMLPFVIAGGILIAISFMFGIKSADPSDPHFSKIAKFFSDLGGGNGAFGLMVPILSAFIALSIAGRPAFMPGFIGGLIASHGSIDPNAAHTVSAGFLGGIVSGFAAGYSMLLIMKATNFIPKSFNSIKPILLYPVLGLLTIGLIMLVAVIPLVWINTSLSGVLKSLSGTNKILLGLIVAAMMAVDMGGPINKAAYVFGTSQLGINNEIMAAVMIGGMVPPLAIALSTTFNKKIWTKEEQISGLSNWIMGLSFITEGAIPFASANPGVVITSSVVGSATAGLLSMIFSCSLPAPHGGIFVFPLIGNVIYYIIALISGSLVGMFALNILKTLQLKKQK